MRSWREEFEKAAELATTSESAPHQTSHQPEEVLQINCERPSKAEIEKFIHHMKRGKASGPDKILPRQSRLI